MVELSKHKIGCGGCGATFVVEQTRATKRCPACGTNHSGPWTVPKVESSPLLEVGEPEAMGSVDDQASTDGETITFEIDVKQ